MQQPAWAMHDYFGATAATAEAIPSIKAKRTNARTQKLNRAP